MNTQALLAEFSATKVVDPPRTEVPDINRRLTALKKYLHFKHGPPKQRAVTQQLTIADAIKAGLFG